MADEEKGGAAQGQQGAGTSQGGGGIPAGLEKFAGADGKIDYEKLTKSYQDLQKSHTVLTQENAALKAYRTQREDAETAGKGAGGVEPDVGRTGIEALVDNPDGFVEDKASKVVQRVVGSVVQATLELAHPEIAVDPATGKHKNPKFIEGLNEFARTMPPEVQKSLKNGDYRTQDWVLRLYKSRVNGGQQAGQQGSDGGQFTEGASASSGGGQKKIWTKAEIQQLMRDPKRYAELEPEIREAYAEKRVK